MNALLACIQGQKEFTLKPQLDQEIHSIISSKDMTQQQLNNASKILLLKGSYLDNNQESLLFQIIIHGLVLKKYSHDILMDIAQLINITISDKMHQHILYYVYLCKLYKQKKKAQTVQQQQALNKAINICEEAFKNYVHLLSQIPWNQNLINALVKCITLNAVLFRNHQRQIQEQCITKPEACTLFAVLQFTYLEGKQGINSYQSQVSNTIEQLFDAQYVLASQFDFEKDIPALHTHWQDVMVTEEFKTNLQVNVKAKYSLIFQMIKLFNTASLKQTLHQILHLLKAQLSFIKEDILIDIQVKRILLRIGDILQLNEAFYDSPLLQTRLNKILIDKQIALTPDNYKEIHQTLREYALQMLLILVQSSFAQHLIINSQFIQILLKFIQSQQGHEILLTQVIMTMQQLNFLTTRLELEFQTKILESVEVEFPKFMKNMHNFIKTERLQISVPQSKKPPSKLKDIQLGFSPQDQLNKSKVRQIRNKFEDQFTALSQICVANLRNGYSLDVIKRLYQMLFMIYSFPHDHLILLQLNRVILQNYTEMEVCILQPIKYFLEYLETSEMFQIDLDIQQQSNGLLDLIHHVYSKKKSLVVDNYVSIAKSLNDQFSKLQQIYQSIHSDEQYYSCKENQMEQSDQIVQTANIRKTKSFIGEEESNSKQKQTEEEMFYSINNLIESNKEQHAQQLNTVQQIQITEELDFEIPKVIFD